LKNNNFHGEGVFTSHNGVILEGKWDMGVLTGKTTFSQQGSIQIQGNLSGNHFTSPSVRLNFPPSLYSPHFILSPSLSQIPKRNI